MSIAGLVLGVVGLSLWIGAFGLFVSFSQFLLREQSRAQMTASAFVQDLSDSKIDAALGRAIPGFDRDQLAKASEAMKGNGPFNELMVELQPVPTPGKIEFNRWLVEGDAVFSRARKSIRMRLVNDHGTYRVESFDLK